LQCIRQSAYIGECCHSNETRAPIANPPNSAQPEGAPTIPPSYIRVRAVVWDAARNRQTDTQTAVANILFASAMPHTKCTQQQVISN